MWLSTADPCCRKIMCYVSSFSAMSCEKTCVNKTGFLYCIFDYEPNGVSNMEQTYINITFASVNDNLLYSWESCRCSAETYNITFANNHLFNNNWQSGCSCYPDNFAPINCSIMRPTQTTLISNSEVLTTTIPFSTTTTTTTTTTVTNTSIASFVVPAVTVTMLLCISVAAGSALLCACMKKRKQDLTTLHSDSKDQQK